jgi:hypothetical protein
MLIDVQKRTAEIYERKDITPRRKTIRKTIEFIINSFCICIILYAAELLLYLILLVIIAPKSSSEISSSLDISKIIMKIARYGIAIIYMLSPAFVGMAFMWLKRDYWCAEIAKLEGRLQAMLSGEVRLTLKKIKCRTQKIFVGKFIKLKWNATGEHGDCLQSINVQPVFAQRKTTFGKNKRSPAYWVATLKYSRIPKTGRTDLGWI